jgi:4-amino-4-deoxy-L-arabinose transferase-like glycosyltransferase
MVFSPIALGRASRSRGMEQAQWALYLAGGLIALRFVVAVYLPLSFDEAYFWLWSKHLAVSYYDHPPLIALAIRAGTLVFGDTQWGVRMVSFLASIAASWAVWRAGALLLADELAGAAACVFFNATLMIASQSMSATPDALVLAEAAFLLFFVAKLQASGDGRWWLAIGAALGAAFLTKYTAFFLGAGAALWLISSRQTWTWLSTPWPYAAAAIAIACFVPNLLWNADHDWVSFRFQFGRVVEGRATLKHLGEFLGSQLALASPFILIPALYGLVRKTRPLSIAAALVWPALVYFLVHSIHARVQGNWPSFVYPALAVLAASALQDASHNRLLSWSRVLALPVAGLILAFVYVQTAFGILSWGMHDPIARMTAVDISPVMDEIATLVARDRAGAILTTEYETTGWLSFYLHPHIPIVPVAQEERYPQAPRASVKLLQEPLLYVARKPIFGLPAVAVHFSKITLEKTLPRVRNGVVVEKYYVYSVSGFHGAPIGRLPD